MAPEREHVWNVKLSLFMFERLNGLSQSDLLDAVIFETLKCIQLYLMGEKGYGMHILMRLSQIFLLVSIQLSEDLNHELPVSESFRLLQLLSLKYECLSNLTEMLKSLRCLPSSEKCHCFDLASLKFHQEVYFIHPSQ